MCMCMCMCMCMVPVTAGQWAYTDITTVVAYNAAVYICGSYNHTTAAGVAQSVK